jgi:hypothetical protein
VSNMERLVIAICLVALLGLALALPARGHVPRSANKCKEPGDLAARECLAATAKGQPHRGAQPHAGSEGRSHHHASQTPGEYAAQERIHSRRQETQ